MLALLSCLASATSSTSEKYWAYFPDPPTFQVVTWNSDPIRVNTDQPHLLGGPYTSYNKDHYLINLNYTFRGLTDDLPLCFNFPIVIQAISSLPLRRGVLEPPRKQFRQILQHQNFQIKQEIGWFGYYRSVCPGSLTPINLCSLTLHHNIQTVLMLLLQMSYGKL